MRVIAPGRVCHLPEECFDTCVLFFRRQGGQVVHRHREARRGTNYLNWKARAGIVTEMGAQDFVPRDHIVERGAQSFLVERAFQHDRAPREIREVCLRPLQHPHAFLLRREAIAFRQFRDHACPLRAKIECEGIGAMPCLIMQRKCIKVA
jgi:hypothetical protein